MSEGFAKVRAAVVQASPAVMDREATLEKASRLIDAAAAEGARLILFPEAFIPAYPWGLRFGTRVGGRTAEGRKAWARYWANAVEVPGPATEAIGQAARRAQAYVGIGVIERDQTYSRGTVYCTLLYFGPDGRLLAKHRKLMPTAAERYIWGAGDGSTLPVLDTPHGRLGGLICWENYMPLARMSMYAKGVELYLAPTADSRDAWQATIRHIACEGRCFVLSCCQFVTRGMYPADLEVSDELVELPEVLSRGGSAIVGPLGEYLAGPLFGKEGILTADLDMGQVVQGKFDFDVTGHYARPDVFRLMVNERPMPPVQTASWCGAADPEPNSAAEEAHGS
ncbi:MAG: carbon-nitrogen hydrolase family protein [Armatimonadetes bacterium]|nr:carbon-nitrogen hydrolase family protein [Armatimonadota bacterium]